MLYILFGFTLLLLNHVAYTPCIDVAYYYRFSVVCV